MMKIKKIRAESVQSALRKIREELGPDAVILHTKQLPGENPDGKVEVTAGLDSGGGNGGSAGREAAAAERVQREGRESSELRKSMQQMQRTIERLTKEVQYPELRNLPEVYSDWYLNLVDQEVPLHLVKELIRAAIHSLGEQASTGAVEDYLISSIEEVFTRSESRNSAGAPHIVSIIGPTGVGKTTTIAKLATQKVIEEGRSVAIITADTYRVAATDQLQVFADLIDVPLEIVYTPEEMTAAIGRYPDVDYLYIDTTGRSQRDRKNLETIRHMLEAADPHELHLMLSATTSSATLLAAAKRFSLFPVTDVIISKLDEAETTGSLLTLFHEYDWPVSYFTNGQNVPEDILVGSAMGYTRTLLGAIT